MNIVDLGILLIFAVGFILGWYKGFLVSALNLFSYVIAWCVALLTYSGLSSFIQQTELGSTLLVFTAGAEKLSDMSVANVDVAEIGMERVEQILSTSGLPEPVEGMMVENISNNAFEHLGITTLSDYFNQTLINLSISLISFLIIFFAVRLICQFIIGFVDYVAKLPILRHLDKVLGGVFGIVQSAVIIWVVFAIIPIFMSVLPLENINELIQDSFFGKMFFNSNVIFNVLESVF